MVRARRGGWWIALSLAVMLAAGCASAGPADGDSSPVPADGVAREAIRGDARVAATVEGLTGFGYDFYRVIASFDRNVVISPLSVGYAFALARAGARGETAAQLDRVFGFPGDDVHDALNALTRQVVTVDGPPGPRPARTPGVVVAPTVSIGNGLFAQRGYQIGEPYRRTLAAKYGTGVRTVDFGGGDAKREIDEWARAQTADRIKEVFPQIDPATKVVLGNTVYFRADWTHPFTSTTPEETFTRADGTTVRTTLMHMAGSLRYAAGPSWQAVELPYAQSDFAMWVLLPTGSAKPGPLLAPPTVAAVAEALRPTRIALALPGWDFETRPDLIPALAALGLTAPFGAGADFSGIAPGLFIGQAMHAANITVDKAGTEAAAVAAVAMPDAAPAQPEVRLRADRPFAFAIVHLPTRAPLFIGHVADPTG